MNLSLRSPMGLLTLSSIKGIGSTTAEKLSNKFETFDEVLGATDADFKGVANQTVVAKLRDKELLRVALDASGAIADRAERSGVRMVSIYDESYPIRLFDCDPMPQLLYVRGKLPGTKVVACTGSREPNEYGIASATRISNLLAESGWTISSGLANGIDSIAQTAALEHRVPSIAVIGTGIDIYSSGRSRDLADKIIDNGGCVMTEQAFGFEGDQGSMIRRNRLVTGLAAATCIFQTPMDGNSMALHTVRYSVHQGRPIFTPATPGIYMCDETAGNEALTDLTGPQLAGIIDVKDSIRDILEKDFADVSVAMALSGKSEYPAVLAWLDELHAAVEERHSMQDHSPAFA